MSSNDWKEVSLGDVIDTISNKHKFDKDKIILINTSDVFNGKVLNHEYVENLNLRGQFKKAFQKDDILYSEIRPKNKRFAYINFDSEDYVASTKLMVLRKKSNEINTKYIYQVLKSDDIINQLQIMAESRSGTFPQITYKELSRINILLPSIKEQKSIAAILSCIENKIDINNQINKNLEKMAQAIYKSWFVDFEPFKDGAFEETEFGKIPKDWRVLNIEDISKNVICGKTPTTKDKDNYGDLIPFITIPDMHGKVFIIETERYLSKKGNNTQINKMLPLNSILVSCIATPGLVSLTSRASQTNQQINSIICKDNISYYYVYLCMRSYREKIKDLGSGGSTTLNLNKNQFLKIKLVVPSEEEMTKFHEMIKPIFLQILENQNQINRLLKIRNALLPKLMSGEISIPIEE